MRKSPIYLDHAATTPLDSRVLEAMLPHLTTTWGNPSSPHAVGREARSALDAARSSIAGILKVAPEEVIFVASGSEGNSLAIFGRAQWWMTRHGSTGHMALLAIEHHCSVRAVERLKSGGWDIQLLPVDQEGILRFDEVQRQLRSDTALVSVQWANNEVGTIQPIGEIARICAAKDIAFHSDGVQGAGQLPFPDPLPPLFTIAAHKFYGPKGIGILVVRRGTGLEPLILGGGQEFSLRAGTENLPAIVGMAKALELAEEEREAESKRLTRLRDAFLASLEDLPGVTLNGDRTRRLPNNVNVHIRGDAQAVVMRLDLAGICASTGAACSIGAGEPSHVLQAMGRSPSASRENLRFTLGKSTTDEDVKRTVAVLRKILRSDEDSDSD